VQSELVVRWLSNVDHVACSGIGLVEAFAALARRRDDGTLTAKGPATAAERFRDAWDTVAVVDLDAEAAASLAMARGLRSLDAMHLAAAVSLAEMLASLPMTFATFDRRLARVASDVGLAVWPEESGASTG